MCRLQNLFVITPLNLTEWKAVVYISFPIIVLDEVFKFLTTRFVGKLLNSVPHIQLNLPNSTASKAQSRVDTHKS